MLVKAVASGAPLTPHLSVSVWHPSRVNIRESARNLTRSAANQLGYDVHRRDLSHPARRAAAMRLRNIDLVLDIGANGGQYVSWLREFGYDGQIVSFEPIPRVFEDLRARYAGDARWAGRCCAVGAEPGELEINVSESSLLSSFLPARAELSSRIHAAEVTEKLSVPVVRLDDVWDDVVPAGSAPMLKIDVQGFEHHVLDGAETHLRDIGLIEVEMGLDRLYDGGSSLYDLLPRLTDHGFRVISIDDGFVDAGTGQVLDIDLLAGRSVE